MTPTKDTREIERKFVVQLDQEELKSKPEVQVRDIEQYYLVVEENVEVRLRNDSGEFILTLKGYGGLTRPEIELSINQELYESAKEWRLGYIIRKRRYVYPIPAELIWEIDIFENEELQGLVFAEVELEKENQPWKEPDVFRIITEVTEDRVYQNKNLVRYGRPPAVYVPELPRSGRGSVRGISRR